MLWMRMTRLAGAIMAAVGDDGAIDLSEVARIAAIVGNDASLTVPDSHRLAAALEGAADAIRDGRLSGGEALVVVAKACPGLKIQVL